MTNASLLGAQHALTCFGHASQIKFIRARVNDGDKSATRKNLTLFFLCSLFATVSPKLVLLVVSWLDRCPKWHRSFPSECNAIVTNISAARKELDLCEADAL